MVVQALPFTRTNSRFQRGKYGLARFHMKIELRERSYSISCKSCFVDFFGHAICSNCADGYLLKDIEDGLSRLFRVFHLTETRTPKNKIRIKIDELDIETDVDLRYSVITTFHELIDRTSTHREYSIDEIECSACQSGHLIFLIPDNSECPNCGRNGLSRGDNVILFPLEIDSKQDSN